METFIPALSPLLVYTPCKDCGVGPVGWRTGNITADRPPSVIGSMSRLSIGVNFTGTGVAFSFTQPIPENWIHRLLVNGSAPPPSSSYTTTSLTNLPLGSHRFALDLFPPSSDPFSPTPPSNASVAFTGATGHLGTMLTAATKNVTIDDTAWRSNQVLLSPGWNMLEGASGGQSNWINTAQMDEERPRANQSWNESVSWTEERGANSTIVFGGEAVWVYGVSGPEGGRYEVVLDGKSAGVYNSSAVTRTYGQILYHTTSLGAGNHSLTLRNMDSGKRLYFDRLVAMTGMGAAALKPSTTGTANVFPSPSVAGSESSTKKLGDGALAGIAIGGILAALCLVAGVLFLLWRRDKKKKAVGEVQAEEKYDDKDKTFFKWPRSDEPPFARMDPDVPHAGLITRAWLGTWAKSPSSATGRDQSFVPGIPSTPRSGGLNSSTNLPQPPSEDRYTSFLKFSKSPGKVRRSKISSPVPLERPDLSGHEGLGGGAMGAAVAGKVVSPLAQLRGGDLGEIGYPPTESKGQGASLWRKPSVDTIGKIFGSYGGGRDTIPAGNGAVGQMGGREVLSHAGPKPGQPHAF